MIEAELRELARAVVALAQPGEQLEVVMAEGTRNEVRVHGGNVESFTQASSRAVGIRVIRDQRLGFAHAGSLDQSVISEVLADARDNLQFAEPDEHVILAEPDGVVPAEFRPDQTAVSGVTAEQRIDLALSTEAATLAADSRIRGVRVASYSDVVGRRSIVSTAGIDQTSSSASASIATSALLDDPNGGTRTGFAADSARDPLALNADEVGSLAASRAAQLLGAKSPSTARVAVILEPRFTATILSVVMGMLTGDVVAKGRSPFADRIDETISTSALNMADNPTDEMSMGYGAIDGEGLATRPTSLVEGGVLMSFLTDTKSGLDLGVASTASAMRGARSTPSPGYRVLTVTGGEGDLQSIVASYDDAFFVCSLQGLHSGVNPISGDFSVGVEGIRIRSGKWAEPIREATLAGSIPRMLVDIEQVGADLERLPSGSLVPSLVIGGLTLGGT